MLLPASHGLRQKSVRVVPEGITFAPHLIEQPRRYEKTPTVLDLRAWPILRGLAFRPSLVFPRF